LKFIIYKTTKRIFCLGFILFFICFHTASTAQQPKKIALLPFKVNAQQDMTFLQNGIFDMLTSRLSKAGEVEVLDRREAESAMKSVAGAKPVDENLARKIGQQLDADFVLFGSLTVFGNSISIDSKMVDVAGARPTMTFFDQSQDLGAVITKINLMAANINAELFGRTAAATPSPAPAQATAGAAQARAEPSEQPDIHAHPEKLLESDRPDEAGELGLGEDGVRKIYRNFWRSASFKYLINGVAVGDVDGDNKLETVVITPHVVMIYRSERKKFFKTHELAESKHKYFIGVDVADINDNGYAEIFVTSLNNLKNRVSSFVLEYDGKAYNTIVDSSRWFYRVADLSEGEKILLGQKHKSGQPFSGDIFKMDWQNSDYDPLDQIKTPRDLSLMGLTVGEVLNDNQEIAAAYKSNDRIQLFDTAGNEIWSGAERHGGSMLYYAAARRDLGDVENRLYFPLRLICRIGNGKSREIIAVKNHDLTNMKLEYRKFTQGYIESLSWTGLGLAPNWKTRKISGYIQDFALGDFDNDGQTELVAAVVVKAGSIAFTTPKSVLIAYDLNS
jgi:TolB-like protein